MKRTASAMIMLAALGGCTSMSSAPNLVGCQTKNLDSSRASIPGVQGPWGQPVPYSSARATPPAGAVVPASYTTSIDNLKDKEVDPSIVQANYVPAPLPNYAGQFGGGACIANAGGGLPPGMAPFARKRSEVRFVGPAGTKISWYVPASDGRGAFATSFLTAPARYNFLQGAVYRLKLSDIPNRPGLELYPTLEVVPTGPKSDPFIAHSAVPVNFSDEDLDQVAAGNFVIKVIYLPDPQFQDLATVGPDEVVSSRLEPGVDPLVEAHRRGSILLVVRLGNIDLEAPNTPSMDSAGGPPPTPSRIGMIRSVVPGKAPATSMQAPGKLPVGPGSAQPTQGSPVSASPYQAMPMQPVPLRSVPTMPAIPSRTMVAPADATSSTMTAPAASGSQPATVHVESKADSQATWWTPSDSGKK